MASGIVECPQCGTRNRVPSSTASGKPRCAQCRQWLPWIVDAGDADYTAVVEQASVPVLVDLWAPWCGPCRTVSPALEQLATERAGRLKLVKVNVDNAPQISHRFEVQAVPTLLITQRGKVLARRAGAAPVAALRAWVDGTLSD
ncbi:thioredoxin [Mycobacterium sp. CVI_P3]|uniref:Thioredoxin n=1 Tax=Mycobacterium pinniadriaticum TaxID=2994102 RepID=A0ABT3S7J6_9MYCO|nr:thioredoxin [Mycobacterium pinniadriaticum]MCX2928994.1 thioredoxin [Mycobacterium pinniadriaticum]MCX2935139.1 thioredoxin [Mycobacterium pinniadriaticum]